MVPPLTPSQMQAINALFPTPPSYEQLQAEIAILMGDELACLAIEICRIIWFPGFAPVYTPE